MGSQAAPVRILSLQPLNSVALGKSPSEPQVREEERVLFPLFFLKPTRSQCSQGPVTELSEFSQQPLGGSFYYYSHFTGVTTKGNVTCPRFCG